MAGLACTMLYSFYSVLVILLKYELTTFSMVSATVALLVCDLNARTEYGYVQ